MVTNFYAYFDYIHSYIALLVLKPKYITIMLWCCILIFNHTGAVFDQEKMCQHFMTYSMYCIRLCEIENACLPITSMLILLSAVRFGVVLITPLHWYTLPSSAVVNNEML